MNIIEKISEIPQYCLRLDDLLDDIESKFDEAIEKLEELNNTLDKIIENTEEI